LAKVSAISTPAYSIMQMLREIEIAINTAGFLLHGQLPSIIIRPGSVETLLIDTFNVNLLQIPACFLWQSLEDLQPYHANHTQIQEPLWREAKATVATLFCIEV
jgi:hypothetical protein